MKKSISQMYVGVDVSKNYLDVHMHPLDKFLRIPNTPQGTRDLLKQLAKYHVIQVVCESSGSSRCGYIDKKNRKTQTKFSCKSCFYQINADLKAARNIKGRYQESGAIGAVRWAPVNEPIVTESLSLVASLGL